MAGPTRCYVDAGSKKTRVYTSDDPAPHENKTFLTIALLVCSAAMGSHARASDYKNPDPSDNFEIGSTVTGHVYLGDTKAPARQSEVFLEPASSLETDAPPYQTGNSKSEPVTLGVETRFDGSFTFTHVTPGSYYIIAISAGYISPFVELRLASNHSSLSELTPLDPEQTKRKNLILRSLAKVDEQANLPASADIVLERGAAVSGYISYDDSGPAAGLRVSVLAHADRDGKETWTPVDLDTGPFMTIPAGSSTDDRGNYRLSGLPPGEYAIEAELRFYGTRRSDDLNAVGFF